MRPSGGATFIAYERLAEVELTDLIGELATNSEEFRALWAAHNVRLHTNGVKTLNHPIVGELELNFERLDVMADSGLMIVVYTAEPASRSAPAARSPRELGSDRSRGSCFERSRRPPNRWEYEQLGHLSMSEPFHNEGSDADQFSKRQN